MKYCYTIIFIWLLNVSSAQSHVDSLKALLPQKAGMEKVDILNKISFYYWNKSPKKGIEHGEKAQKLSTEIEYRIGEARALLYIGVNYWAKGVFDTALTSTYNALKIFEEEGNKKGIKSSINNIGIIYNATYNYEKAIEFFIKAKQLSIELNEIKGQINNNNNIGVAYTHLKKHEKALDFFYQNIELSKHNKVEDIISSSYSNIGVCFMELNRPMEAIPYLEKAYALELNISNKHQAAQSANQLGLVYLNLKNKNRAIVYFNEAEKLAIESQALEPLRSIQENLADYYIATNNFRKAIDYKDKFIVTNDSLYNERSSQQISKMRTQFEYETKEKEIELLRKVTKINELEIEKQTNLKNSFIGIALLVLIIALIMINRFIIKKKANLALFEKNEIIDQQKEELLTINEKLKLYNVTKDKFLTIIAHDLKGPLNTILSYSHILTDEYDSCDDSEKLKFLTYINKSSQSAYRLLENLLIWAQTQTEGIRIIKKATNLKDLVETSIAPYQLNASKKNIDIVMNIPSETNLFIDKNTAITFIGNIVNNAIKFTPHGGNVFIEVHDIDNTINLTIIDTGIGISPEIKEKLFHIDESISTEGTNNEKGSGLGLILCKEFIEKNDGKIRVESEVGKGSKFIISIPKDNKRKL